MANRHSRSELSLGTQSVDAWLQSALKTGLVLLVCWLTLWAASSLLAVKASTTEGERYGCLKWHQAQLAAGVFHLPRWKMEYVDESGAHPTTAGQLYAWPALADYAQSIRHRVAIRMQVCGLISLVLTALLAWGLHRLGVNLRRDHRLRGGYRVTAGDLRKDIQRRKQASSITIGGIPLVRGSETLHMLVLGTPGAGKSVLLDSLIQQFGRGMPILVYDTKGDFLVRHFDPKQDTVLSFLDARMPSWTLWDEVEDDADAMLVAELLIPVPSGAQDPFWPKAARQLLADILLRISPAKRTNRELKRVCVMAEASELQALLRGSVAATFFSDAKDDKTARSIRVTLTAHLRSLQFLNPDARPGEGFSMRRWMRASVQDDTAGRLFLTCPPHQAAALSPLVSVLFESAAMSLMALGPDRQRRVGFVLDEFPTLPVMPTMERLIAEGRGYGAVVVIAAQANAQIRRTYGEDSAEALASLCSTQVVFRLNEFKSAEMASKLLGEAEYDESKESESHGLQGTTTSLGSQRALRRAVLPSEITSLPDLTCFLKVAGDYPVAKVKLSVLNLPTVARSYIPKPISEEAEFSEGVDDSVPTAPHMDEGLI